MGSQQGGNQNACGSSAFCSPCLVNVHSSYLLYNQRRTRQPYGMEGGGPGAMGRNTWVKCSRKEDGDLVDIDNTGASTSQGPIPTTRNINIGGKATVWMGKGDRLVIETPGAGAWGVAPDSSSQPEIVQEHKPQWEPRGSFAERAKAQAAF